MSHAAERAPLVLLVDDDLMIPGLLARTLEAAGLRVRLASSGAQALATLDEAAAPDLAVLDITMPGMSGLELAAQLDGVPHMFLSANDAQQVVEQAARSASCASRSTWRNCCRQCAPRWRAAPKSAACGPRSNGWARPCARRATPARRSAC